MATNSTLLPHLSFLLFLIVSTAATATTQDDEPMRGAPLIRHACEDTKYYDLCVSSLISRPGSSKFLFKDLDKPVVAVTIESASETRRQIRTTMWRRPSTKGSLGACSKFYNLAIYNLRLAEKYLNSNGFKETYEYGPVEGWTRAAQGYFNKCGATLKKQRGVGAPLKQRNEIARRLADNAFVIVGDLMVNRGLLSSGIMSSYVVFLCWSAIRREEAGVTTSELVFIGRQLAGVHPLTWKSRYHLLEF